MLMFVFGAGASFDSDPHRPPGRGARDDLNRPPLAGRLFEPDWTPSRDAASSFPRASPLLLRLRESASAGEDIEEVLEGIQSQSEHYAGTAVQLLALRAYLAQLLREGPAQWLEECQGQTNYVLSMDEAARWRASILPDQPIICVTFNYDTMLESACMSVFGRAFGRMGDYASGDDVRLYKPHGSVNWRQRAVWGEDPHSWMMGSRSLHVAIDQAASLRFDEVYKVDQSDEYQRAEDAQAGHVWPPGLTIPVRSKSVFTMPPDHLERLCRDLGAVTTVIAVGWRARERHFLQLLQDHLPSTPAKLVAVAESTESALETVDSLWQTGKFANYATSVHGFSHFTRSADASRDRSEGGTRLRDVLTLRAGLWTRRKAGQGLQPWEEVEPISYGYVDD